MVQKVACPRARDSGFDSRVLMSSVVKGNEAPA